MMVITRALLQIVGRAYNCRFRYGGRSSWASLTVRDSEPAITNTHFYKNNGAISISTSTDLSLDQNTFKENTYGIQNLINSATLTVDSCIFKNNQKGIINESPFLVVSNSALLDNTVYDIENLDTEDVQAANNWWGEDDFTVMELNTDSLDFPFIYDKTDDATKGRVLYYPPFLPDSVNAPPNIPDLTISNVFSGLTNAIPGDTVTVTWNLNNIGEGFAVVDWAEKIYIQAPDGQNRTLVGQFYAQETDTLQFGSTYNRSLDVVLPNPITIGNAGVFAVEVVPAEVVGESPLLTGNNFAVESQAWNNEAELYLSISDNEITENGASLYCILTRNGSTENELIVDITPSAPARFVYPAQVTIAAGQSGKSFYISATDNDDLLFQTCQQIWKKEPHLILIFLLT